MFQHDAKKEGKREGVEQAQQARRPVSGHPMQAKIMQMQKTFGNRAVLHILQATQQPSVSAEQVEPAAQLAKVEPNWKRGDDLNDAEATQVKQFVDWASQKISDIADQVLANPTGLPADGKGAGHIRRFQGLYADFLQDGSTQFLHAAFGYAVETLATAQFQAPSNLPPGWKIAFQVARGTTRPDIVLFDQNDNEAAWFDITSEDSPNHIDKKVGGGWRNKKYVAELFYEALDTSKLGKGGTPASSAKINTMVRARKQDMQRREKALMNSLEKFYKNNFAGQDPYDAKKNHQLTRTFLAELLGVEDHDMTHDIARSLIETFAGYDIGEFGYNKRALKQGRNKAEAELFLLNWEL